MTRKLTAEEKQNRKPASRACTFCHKKHLQCSNERPCKNCVKRDIADSCQDIERKRAKYLRQDKTGNSVLPTSPEPSIHEVFTSPSNLSGNTLLQTSPRNKSSININQTFPSVNTTDEVLSKLFSTEMKQSNSDYYENIFDSNYLDQEYKMLGDIITNSKPASPTPTNSIGSPVPNSFISPMIVNEEKLKDTRPFISFGIPQESIEEDDQNQFPGSNPGQTNVDVTMKVDLTSHLLADTTTDYVSPMKSHQVYKNVPDIYSNDIIYFDYPQLYHSLTFFLKKRFLGKNLTEQEKQLKRNNLLIILKLIASYRPTFISAHKSLYKPWDLQFLEMTFQRSLLDFEKLSNLNSSPTIIWRRTGEIVSISNDLISLLNWDINEILSKRTFIMELMYDDQSIINYFQLFKSVAVGNLHSSIITKCKLKKQLAENNSAGMRMNNNLKNFNFANNTNEFMEFCSVWTVKRDIFDIPMLILGQFLPILSPTDSFRTY